MSSTDAKAWIATPEALAGAIARAADAEVRFTLAQAGVMLVQAKRYRDAIAVYDAIVDYRDNDLSAYCNALWVVQHDNTGLPVDPERARRYLAASLPYAGANPPIRLNAAGVLAELGDHDAALAELVTGAHEGFDIRPFLDEKLFAPLRAHARWPEVLAAAAPAVSRFADLVRDAGGALPGIEEPFHDWLWGHQHAAARGVPPAAMVTALERALDAGDARVRQGAVRLLLWWLNEDGDDGHGGMPPPWMAEWYEAIGGEIAARVSPVRLAELIAQDLGGPHARTAAHSLVVIGRVHGWSSHAPRIAAVLAAAMRPHLEAADWHRRQQVADAMWHLARGQELRGLAPLVAAELDELAALDPALGYSEAQRDFAFHAAMAMKELGAAEAGPPAARLLARAWRSLRAAEYVVELVGAVREPSALPALVEILRDGAGTQPWMAATSAVGWLRDASAIEPLKLARRAAPKHWSKNQLATPRRRAAVSLLQLGSLDAGADILRWVRTAETAYPGDLRDLLPPLADAAVAARDRAPIDATWRTFAASLVDALRELVDRVAASGYGTTVSPLLARAIDEWRALA